MTPHDDLNEQDDDLDEFDDLGLLHRAELTDDLRKVLGSKDPRSPSDPEPRDFGGWHDLPDDILG